MPSVGEDPAAWSLASAAVVAAIGGAGAWLTASLKLRQARRIATAAAPADLATAYATFAKTLNDQAEAFIRALQEERANLVKRLGEMSQEILALQTEHQECLGDNRNLHQRIDSLESRLRNSGIDIPGRELAGSFMAIEDGKTTILRQHPTEPPP